jgi:hypothetical protein
VERTNLASACGGGSRDKRYRFFFRNRRPGHGLVLHDNAGGEAVAELARIVAGAAAGGGGYVEEGAWGEAAGKIVGVRRIMRQDMIRLRVSHHDSPSSAHGLAARPEISSREQRRGRCNINKILSEIKEGTSIRQDEGGPFTFRIHLCTIDAASERRTRIPSKTSNSISSTPPLRRNEASGAQRGVTNEQLNAELFV